MKRDHQDALIDQILREILGGDRPRDMTARVLAQAKIIDRFRRRWWLSGAAGIAAAIAITISVVMYWPRYYPAPQVSIASLSNAAVERGASITTNEDDSGTLELGGYVNIGVSPSTELMIVGSQYKEAVQLERGHLDTTVTKHTGTFDIAVGPANVHVTGTSFGVNVTEESTATEVIKKMQVLVTEGSVVVERTFGQTSPETVQAGDANGKEFVISRTQIPSGQVESKTSAGLLAGAQFGARTGNLGIQVAKLPEGRGANRANSVISSAARPLQIEKGSPRRSGRLRYLDAVDLYYLETQRDGSFILFPGSSIPDPKFKLLRDAAAIVNWKDGKVVSLDQQ